MIHWGNEVLRGLCVLDTRAGLQIYVPTVNGLNMQRI